MSISTSSRPLGSVAQPNSTGLRNYRRQSPPAIAVVTSPPWAIDEPPSPNERNSMEERVHQTESRISDVSFQTFPSEGSSRWWTFAIPRPRPRPLDPSSSQKPDRRTFRDISLSWIPTSASQREASTSTRKDKENENDDVTSPLPIPRSARLNGPFTLSHTNTAGWNTPWTSKQGAQGPLRLSAGETSSSAALEVDNSSHNDLTGWSLRRKRIRSFILTNPYVPILFRIINIIFTTSALVMAVQIRKIEIKNNVVGIVGSSPTVVIIFAPLTLVHVMIAIYLEYFGRPLGLWRTSGKLAHTLSEVLFICAWSAALSLCFDNFFTSLIPCARESATAWYNKLPRPQLNIPNLEGVGNRICDFQLSLICLVGVGLTAYCSNLVISLYRIFEKVKYHSIIRI